MWNALIPPLPTPSGFADITQFQTRTAWAKAEEGCAETAALRPPLPTLRFHTQRRRFFQRPA
jgi:hypothetical protein